MNNKIIKKTILIDLDGVLNTYTGNFNENFIPQIKHGAKDFLKELSLDFEIKIFTTRNKNLVSKWVLENKINDFVNGITDKKELAWIYIDDRCIKFDGNYQNLKSEIINFKPWYKN